MRNDDIGESLYFQNSRRYMNCAPHHYNLDRQSLFARQPMNEDYHKQVIIHFAGHAKPWHAWVQTWDVVKEYAAIQQKSPWKDYPSIPARTHKHMHQAARTARMYGHYGEMVKWYLKYLGAKL